MLFGTWSQAHTYDPSDYMEARLYRYQIKRAFLRDTVLLVVNCVQRKLDIAGNCIITCSKFIVSHLYNKCHKKRLLPLIVWKFFNRLSFKLFPVTELSLHVF